MNTPAIDNMSLLVSAQARRVQYDGDGEICYLPLSEVWSVERQLLGQKRERMYPATHIQGNQ